ARSSRWVMVASCLSSVSMPPLAMHGEVVGIDEVGNRPTFEVVLCHALLRESLDTLGIAVRERAEQAVAADLLRAPAIVDLVELVTGAELGADRVPQKLHQLRALLSGVAVRAAHVAVDVRPDLGIREIACVRVQVD